MVPYQDASENVDRQMGLGDGRLLDSERGARETPFRGQQRLCGCWEGRGPRNSRNRQSGRSKEAVKIK